jgi:hypothetical protein
LTRNNGRSGDGSEDWGCEGEGRNVGRLGGGQQFQEEAGTLAGAWLGGNMIALGREMVEEDVGDPSRLEGGREKAETENDWALV